MLLAAGCGTKEPPPAPREAAPSVPTREDVKDERPVVLAFGDSLSAGYGVETGLSYPDFLQKEIDAKGFKYRVVNQGISGDTTSGGLARLGQGLETKPYLVILELGGNDGLRGLPLTVTRHNLDRMTAAFKESGAKVVIAGMTLPRNYGADYIREFEQIYPAIEKKHGVKRMRFLLEGVAMNPSLMQRDEIHPNAEGNEIVARNVMKVIEPMLKK